MSTQLQVMDAAGIARFRALRNSAIDAVTERFYGTHNSVYARFGQRGRDACREDLGFHLDFLQPLLEFGVVDPMVDYLRWLAGVLSSRGIPAEHLPLSLDWLAEFFDQRMDPADARVVTGALSAASGRFHELGRLSEGSEADEPARWAECDRFEAQLLAGDHRAALSTFDASLDQSSSLVESEAHVIQPSLYSIGRKWQRNAVTVAQEHLSTSIATLAMTRGLLRAEAPPPVGKKILLACVPGNEHAVGLQMVADAFQIGGWDLQFLGANVPAAALVGHVATWRPDVVGLSVTFPHQFRAVKEIIAGLDSLPDQPRPRVLVGGLAINRFHAIVKALGADAWSSSAVTAVDVANRLVMATTA